MPPDTFGDKLVMQLYRSPSDSHPVGFGFVHYFLFSSGLYFSMSERFTGRDTYKGNLSLTLRPGVA